MVTKQWEIFGNPELHGVGRILSTCCGRWCDWRCDDTLDAWDCPRCKDAQTCKEAEQVAYCRWDSVSGRLCHTGQGTSIWPACGGLLSLPVVRSCSSVGPEKCWQLHCGYSEWKRREAWLHRVFNFWLQKVESEPLYGHSIHSPCANLWIAWLQLGKTLHQECSRDWPWLCRESSWCNHAKTVSWWVADGKGGDISWDYWVA